MGWGLVAWEVEVVERCLSNLRAEEEREENEKELRFDEFIGHVEVVLQRGLKYLVVDIKPRRIDCLKRPNR